jgi:hypothetical protein
MRRDGVEDEARVLRGAIRGLGRKHPTEEIPQELRTQIVEFTRQAKCVIRPMSIADSDACRSGIPMHVDRRFR